MFFIEGADAVHDEGFWLAEGAEVEGLHYLLILIIVIIILIVIIEISFEY